MIACEHKELILLSSSAWNQLDNMMNAILISVQKSLCPATGGLEVRLGDCAPDGRSSAFCCGIFQRSEWKASWKQVVRKSTVILPTWLPCCSQAANTEKDGGLSAGENKVCRLYVFSTMFEACTVCLRNIWDSGHFNCVFQVWSRG